VLYVAFEESGVSMLAGMRSIGIDLQPHVENRTLRILSTMPESFNTEHHLLRIFDLMDVFDPQHMVVDAISARDRMGSSIAAFDFLIHLLTKSRERSITCIFTNQNSGLLQLSELGESDIYSLIDTLIMLRYHDDGFELSRRMLVFKSRGTAHSTHYHNLMFSNEGIDISPVVQNE
jgi:circadian clock protein KaiC